MIDNWSWLDLLALAVILISIVTALFKGIAAELISLTGVLLGLAMGVIFYPTAGGLLQHLGLEAMTALLLGFLLPFAGCLLAAALLIRLADSTLRALYLKWADRLLGGAFGLLRGWLMVAVVFLALAAFPVSTGILEESRTAAFFLTTADLLVEVTPSDFRKRFEKGYREIYQKWIEPSVAETGQP